MANKYVYPILFLVFLIGFLGFFSYNNYSKLDSQNKVLQEKYDAVVKEKNDFAEKLNTASREYILCYWAYSCNKFPDVCRDEGITDYDIDVAERACSNPDTYVAIQRMFAGLEKRR